MSRLLRNLTLPLGIICGVFVTFVVRFVYWRSENVHEIRVIPTIEPTVVPTYPKSQQLVDIKSLLREKESLLQRLRDLDMKLEAMSTRNVSQMLSNSPLSNCPYNFKVYVYPIPPSLGSVRYSEEARRNRTLHVCQKCILEQFALEYIMFDFFSQFCGRTNNPEEADYFYLPLVRDAEYRLTLEMKGIRSRAPSPTEQALLNIMEKNDSTLWQSVFQITDKYWCRNLGADHLLIMPAPVTNLRHESSKRGFFHYMSHLHRPIILGVEYSIQFVKEYPICATKKNIVAPYPTSDPDLFNGKLLSYKTPRDSLFYYAGGLHGDCIEIRKAMQVLMRNASRVDHLVPKVRAGQVEREHGFLAATFCPIPIGDSPSSKRMYDVLNFGCIPVVLSDDLVWAFSDQTGGTLNHTDFAMQLPQSIIQFTAARTLQQYAKDKVMLGVLPISGLSLYDLLEKAQKSGLDHDKGVYLNPLVQILKQVPQQDIDYYRQHGNKAAHYYRFYAMNESMSIIPTAQHVLPSGGAIDMVAQALSERKEYGIARLGRECYYEKTQLKHKYVGRYSCDTAKHQSLIRRHR